jgi:hypothetical protein
MAITSLTGIPNFVQWTSATCLRTLVRFQKGFDVVIADKQVRLAYQLTTPTVLSIIQQLFVLIGVASIDMLLVYILPIIFYAGCYC